MLANYKELPDYDVLLSGIGGGELFGQFVDENAKKDGEDRIYSWIFEEYKGGISFMSQSELKEIRMKIREFVTENKTTSHDVKLFQKFLFIQVMSKGKNTYFSSLHSSKPAHSLFLGNELIRYAFGWPMTHLSLAFQKNFFLKVYPELAGINDESLLPPLRWRHKSKRLDYYHKKGCQLKDRLFGTIGLNINRWV